MSKIVIPFLFGLVGVGILVSLGFWQVQRLAWKEELLGKIEERINGPYTPIPINANKSKDQYLKVFADGTYLSGEIHFLTSDRFKGPGFRVIMPFRLKTGRTILVDRGFTKEKFKDKKKRVDSNFLHGNLLWPDETDNFTPSPNFDDNIWFARDVLAMSKFLRTEPILLVLIEENEPDQYIQPKPLTIDIPNNHLEYAITWFSLAAIWFFMTIYFFWFRFREI